MKKVLDVVYQDAAFAPVTRATLDLACLVVVVASLTNAEAVLLEAIIITILGNISATAGLLRFLWIAAIDAFIQVD